MARRSAGPRPVKSPYEGARVEALEEPLLPRWFVLLMVVAVPVAIGVALWALLSFGSTDLAVEARRPPPSPDSSLTTPVGQFAVGELEPVAIDPSCPVLSGIHAAGTALDRQRIEFAIDALCEIRLPEDVGRRLQAFGQAGGVVRFAQFEATGIDSTLDPSGDVPVVLINARLARESTDPLWIAPLVVHDTTYLELEPGSVEGALDARRGEAEICARLFDPASSDAAFPESDPSRACDDAQALLALPDPAAALQEQGFTG